MNKKLIWITVLIVALSVVAGAASVSRQKKVLVKSKGANIVDKASKSGKILGKQEEFDPLEIISTSGSYTQVKASTGTKGYVLSSSLSDRPFASIGAKLANVRSGPGSNDTVIFTLQLHYPIRIVDKKGTRVFLEDYEGDKGWIHSSMLSSKNYVIVKMKTINVREGTSVNSSLRFTAEKGVVFEVLGEDPKTGWIHIKHPDGDDGWCSPKIVWGWVVE